MIGKEKYEELHNRMEMNGIKEEDLLEKFILGSGKGGQKLNKTSSCVYLKHIPTGIEVKCQKDRSREKNRFFARRQLCLEIEEREHTVKTERRKEHEKIRRQKRRLSRRAKQRMRVGKEAHAEKKELRKKVMPPE